MQRAAAPLLIFLTGLAAPNAVPTPASPPAACALITGDELEAAQQSELSEATATELVRDGLAVSRCFFRTRDFARSVSLEITRRLPESRDAGGPRERWQAMFHGDADKEEREHEPSRGGAGTEEGEKQEPQPIAGLGDEAFWLGTGTYGVLYVLEGELYLRISAGGPGSREEKLLHSRVLATRALARLAGGG
ncbi:MAG TPA: hypothetical protein VGS57_18785 [Thermoanaerobaculia bacterium]|nr:hypothetical protein [Thermoanaerobaculia bacterium]